MFIIRNIPERKHFVDIKYVTITADSPDLSNSVTELAYSMLKSFTRHKQVSPLRRRIFLYIYQWISLSQSVVICMWSMQSNFDANNKLHTFLSKKQYSNIQGVGLQLIGSNERIFGNIPEHILHRSHNRDQIITFIKDTKSRVAVNVSR